MFLGWQKPWAVDKSSKDSIPTSTCGLNEANEFSDSASFNDKITNASNSSSQNQTRKSTVITLAVKRAESAYITCKNCKDFIFRLGFENLDV